MLAAAGVRTIDGTPLGGGRRDDEEALMTGGTKGEAARLNRGFGRLTALGVILVVAGLVGLVHTESGGRRIVGLVADTVSGRPGGSDKPVQPE